RSSRSLLRFLRLPQRKGWRSRVLNVLMSWNRNQAGRIVGFTLLTWIVGALAMFLLEGPGNEGYASLPDALWNAWPLLFTGPDPPPKTWPGRLVVVALLGVGIGLVGLFAASIASILIEPYPRASHTSRVGGSSGRARLRPSRHRARAL